MKTLVVLQLIICCSLNAAAQGTDCSNAISLNLNGSLNNYSTSSSTDVNVLCTDNGTTPVTWFQFTTNASAECPLLNITASDGQAVEVAMYTSCGGNMNGNLETASSMCFNDGTGLWAPSETYVLSGNTTYYLRIKTTTACTISIGGQKTTPSNDDCVGATPINSTPASDNNSCHRPGPGVMAADLCALTLENTAFYEFYVASTGTCVININNILCDNGNLNNSGGFQIGFFSGNCSSLTLLSPCASGSGTGGLVQATTSSLAAGTKVYVAVDGTSGSNCKYDISATNAIVLSTKLKKLSAWKTSNSNILKWTYFNSSSLYFDIERSSDGARFTSIGRITINRSTDVETSYSFDDGYPMSKSFYRLKVVNRDGTMEFSKIVEVTRPEIENHKLNAYVAANSLQIRLNSDLEEKSDLVIVNLFGQRVLSSTLSIKPGTNLFSKDISFLPGGQYFIFVNKKQTRLSQGFIKAH